MTAIVILATTETILVMLNCRIGLEPDSAWKLLNRSRSGSGRVIRRPPTRFYLKAHGVSALTECLAPSSWSPKI